LLGFVLRTADALDTERTVIVAGYESDQVKKAAADLAQNALIVVQPTQNGTADAVLTARAALGDFDGDVVVLYGDTPFIRPQTIRRMLDARANGAAVVVLGFETPTPGRYGRLITNAHGQLVEIVEAKDASATQLAITACNSGVVCADRATLFALLDQVGNDNASGEFYLTDIVALARAENKNCAVVICDEAETIGINSRAELAAAEAAFQAGARLAALENGATLAAPDTVFLSYDTAIGRDVVIGQNVVFGPGVTVESGAKIQPFCHLEGCHISRGAIVGPFARLRPGAEISDDAHVGNFVEIKNSAIGDGAKVNHLSYVGDSDIGAQANIGAGTITCNYDGVMKHRTLIGAHAFIGSNTTLVAPVSVGEDTITAAGSVITQNVEDRALAITRPRQETKPERAAKHMARLRAIKAGQDKS